MIVSEVSFYYIFQINNQFEIFKFFDSIVTKDLDNYFEQVQAVGVMLVCGGLVTFQSAKNDLKQVFTRYFICYLLFSFN